MIKFGKRIYFDKITGNIIVDTGEGMGEIPEASSIDHDFAVYQLLKERVRDTVGVIELEYGEYEQDFRECSVYRVNPETKTLEFSYPDPNEQEPSEPVYQKPLSEDVERLKQEDLNNKEAIAELYILSMGGF